MSSAAAETNPIWARIRLADAGDVSTIHRLLRGLAEYENQTHQFTATESSLSATLFPSSPFRSFTILLLEISPNPINDDLPNPDFTPIVRRVDLGPVQDPEAATFASARGGEVAVAAGFVLFFPNYSTFLAKPGLYVEDLFVRECYRRRGFGRMLLSAVAAKAAEMGFGRVEWTVLDWNVDALRFYEKMGAEVLTEWRICKLSGGALQAYRGGGDV
ncbi:hypothetical protein QJS10_CPB18g01670 [Acorus calamus]|uniref:N-acetyltransferase domain-containing protein n=1 Tax=Acorus calamus TaxID=4465 RepID=A0AAV9CPR6_ACOCL|nr:hypothetical protein QJS10_CPB18g01670 [Acorus calamus]